MNPYASFVAGHDPLAILPTTQDRLRALLDRVGSAANTPEAPGKWSAREVLAHLADCEIVFAFRLRQALAEDRHVIQPFDQDRWAVPYGAYTAADALQMFAALRSWNITLIRSLPAAAYSKMLNHPERGDMTFQVLVETMAGHDLNHVGQMERIAAAVARGAATSR